MNYVRLLLSFYILVLMACSGSGSSTPTQGLEIRSLKKVSFNPQLDILWVIDNSMFMGQHQQNLAYNMDSVFSLLLSGHFDFRMAAVTTDMNAHSVDYNTDGKFVGAVKIIDASESHLEQAFSQMVQVGQNGDETERGIDAILKALSPERLANENKGFLRDSAKLFIIVVSDEDDKSQQSVSDTIFFLNSLKQDTTWQLYHLGALSDTDCKTLNNFSEAGENYFQLANFSMGQAFSLCSEDMPQNLERLMTKILHKATEIKINQALEPETLEVYINNLKLSPTKYTYSPNEKSLRFKDDYIPPVDAIITLSYKPAHSGSAASVSP